MTIADTVSPAPPRSVRRVWSLGRAEALLLWRNRTATANAVLTPVTTVWVLHAAGAFDRGTGSGAALVASLTAFTLVLVVYYNLVSALVARREELVLKRLRTGELSDAEILCGTSAPAVLVALVQVVIGAVAAWLLLDLAAPVNALAVLAALALGCAVFVLLAAASTAFTRNVEMAQVTTMPMVLLPLAFSGVFVPVHVFPAPLEAAAQFMPLTPVVDLLNLGLAGTTRGGSTVDLAGSILPALGPLAILGGWLVVGAWATRRWMRWEPRH